MKENFEELQAPENLSFDFSVSENRLTGKNAERGHYSFLPVRKEGWQGEGNIGEKGIQKIRRA